MGSLTRILVILGAQLKGTLRLCLLKMHLYLGERVKFLSINLRNILLKNILPTDDSDRDVDVIMHTSKTVLFNKS